MGSANSEVISLADLARDPSLVDSLSPERAKALLPQIALLSVAVIGRVILETSREPELPQLIDVKRLGEILNSSTDYVYQHANEWPFTIRLGARDLKFDLHKLNRWLAQRTGAK